MKVNQIYDFVNSAVEQATGESALLEQDLSNIVDVGTTIANGVGYDSFYKALVNRIGKMYFEDRPYKGALPKVFKDAWEFGSIVGRVQVDDMDVGVNDSFEIINGAEYSPFVVNLPVVSAKFYNKMVTFELDITTPEVQIQQSFKSADEMNRFLSMIQTMVYNSMESKIESVTRAMIANFAAVIYGEQGASRVQLLTLYKEATGNTTLTAAHALEDTDFLRFASATLQIYKKKLESRTSLFNLGGKRKFTPEDKLHVVVHSDFAAKIENNLYGNTYHENFVKLPLYEEVAYWQGTGTGFTFADTAAIKVKTSEGSSEEVANLVAVMFDDDALGILQPRRRVTTQYNPKNETYNDFHKWESRYFNDFNQNFVEFVIE